MSELSPENLFIVLSWSGSPALVAACEGTAGAAQVDQAYPKARLVLDYPTLKEALRQAETAKVFEARPFGFKPTLHFCLTAQRGADSAALVVKATCVKKAMRKAKSLAYRGSDITLVGTREELTHYVEQLDEALEHGRPIQLEQDLRGPILVMDGQGALPTDLHDVTVVEPQALLPGMTPEEALAFLRSVPETSRAKTVPELKSLDEAVAQLKEMELESDDGSTCLHLVDDYDWPPYTGAQVARRLLELGADPNARNAYGATPLQRLSERVYFADEVTAEDRELAMALLDGGADPLLGVDGQDPEQTVMPNMAFPDLVEPWLRAASLEVALPPADTTTRGRARL